MPRLSPPLLCWETTWTLRCVLYACARVSDVCVFFRVCVCRLRHYVSQNILLCCTHKHSHKYTHHSSLITHMTQGRNQMLPGPGAAPLTRVPSAGRRAPSAGKPPPSSSSHTAGHAGQGAHTQQGAGDALDAELGRMAHALPPRSASNSRPGSGREASIMATRSRRPSWGAGAEGGSNAQVRKVLLTRVI